jgi:hypothetical protein
MERVYLDGEEELGMGLLFDRVRNDTALSPMLPCSDAPMRFVPRHPDTPFRSKGTAFPLPLPQIVRCDDFIV